MVSWEVAKSEVYPTFQVALAGALSERGLSFIRQRFRATRPRHEGIPGASRGRSGQMVSGGKMGG